MGNAKESSPIQTVEIVERATKEVVWSSKPTYPRNAEKIAEGAGINLNWDDFTIRIVDN